MDSDKRSTRILSCELTPENALNFSYDNPFGSDTPEVSSITGTQKPDGTLTGERRGVGDDGAPYVIRTGEPSLASDSLEHEVLPRIAAKCRDALKP
jgi:hypothetical protein